jgi:hypothetical protein
MAAMGRLRRSGAQLSDLDRSSRVSYAAALSKRCEGIPGALNISHLLHLLAEISACLGNGQRSYSR